MLPRLIATSLSGLVFTAACVAAQSPTPPPTTRSSPIPYPIAHNAPLNATEGPATKKLIFIYLCTRNDVAPDRLAYVGISWGAITGITYAAHDPRIKVVVSMVGGGNFLRLIPGDITAETRKAAEATDPVFHVGLISPRPLLLLNVTKDQLIPRVMAQSLHDAAGPGATKLWLETDHFFRGIDRIQVGETVVKFVEKGMHGPVISWNRDQ